MKNIIKNSLRRYLNEMVSNITQDIARKYSKQDIMYHCGDDFRYKFHTDYIKGGSRGIHGWGIYFASTPFKASDYGAYMTIVDKSNLKLLSLDEKISSDFIRSIELKLKYTSEIRNEINTNPKYENLRDYDINDLDDLKFLVNKLEDVLMRVKNNAEYKEIQDVLSNVKEILGNQKGGDKNTEILYDLKKNTDKSINDFLIFAFNYKTAEYEKDMSLFFKKCGYDGFDYQDYEYIIFNTDNIKVVEHIKIK